MSDNKVRNRQSYKLWMDLGSAGVPHAALPRVYELLDHYCAFGSQMNSDWAKESLDLFLQDVKTVAAQIGV